MFGHDDKNNDDDQQNNDDSGVISGLGTPPTVEPEDNSPFSANGSTASDNSSPASDDGHKSTDASNTNGLLDLKSKALTQLAPLVSHLDQTPEEKFKTTMMMIQASDNQSLVQDAYEAAQRISDEKAKAQALLDVVNEINYFTANQAK